MNRGIVIDQTGLERLNWVSSAQLVWLGSASVGTEMEGIHQIEKAGFLYLIGHGGGADQRLLVIAANDGGSFFRAVPERDRLEAFQRILKVALTGIDRGVRVPFDWRVFHSGSLVSFQSNRFSTGLRSRVYLDFNPEGTDNIYAFNLVDGEKEPLNRSGYDADIVSDAILNYESARSSITGVSGIVDSGQTSIALTQRFPISDVAMGMPFSAWRDSKLTLDQLRFFNAPFSGPLRLRGAAGTGKTLVLCLRFLKEIYDRVDAGSDFRAAFLTHGQETADLIRAYLTHMDERGVLPGIGASNSIEVTTLHGLANQFVNYDSEEVLPISLDGMEGRKLQVELIGSLVQEHVDRYGVRDLEPQSGLREPLEAAAESTARLGFLCDLIDEFSSVLEAYGLREVDQIAERYLRAPFAPKGLAKSESDRLIVLDLYREFRRELAALGVVSLDQFISDFGAYLNSFRWDAVRARKGFDFVFADELHLFNRQERSVLGYLLRDGSGPRCVAVAYDPRQSPRSTFVPEDHQTRDSIWVESNLSSGAQRFELNDVFRYTPEILALLRQLNGHFPADDLSEEWGLVFGKSMLEEGDVPEAHQYKNQIEMVGAAVAEAKRMRRTSPKAKIAVLALDHERFATYVRAGMFQSGFVAVSARDEIGVIQRYPTRVVLSMPEYVAGLQFDQVIILDANGSLASKMGLGAAGTQRFISALYLGASRARYVVKMYSDKSEGGFAGCLRVAMDTSVVRSGGS